MADDSWVLVDPHCDWFHIKRPAPPPSLREVVLAKCSERNFARFVCYAKHRASKIRVADVYPELVAAAPIKHEH